MIGITFALPSESSGVRRRLQDIRRHDNLLSGKIGDRDVTILHTGVGAKNCNARLELLIHKARPGLIISSGFAGAVSEQLRVGDLILAQNFSDPALFTKSERILRNRQPQPVKLFTSTSIVDSVFERNEIARVAGAAAVDMETGAIADVCKVHGVPLLSLRVVSDSASEPFPAPPSVLFDLERQRTPFGRLLAYLLRDPASVARLFRFSRHISDARKKLTEAILALVREL